MIKLSQFIAPVDRYATRYATVMKSYVLIKMILLKIKMSIEQKKQSYSNVATRKCIKKQTVDLFTKSWMDGFFYRDEINQKPTVVPGHRFFVNTT